jgi:acyl carrier protein
MMKSQPAKTSATSQTLPIVQEVIAEILGIEPVEVTLDSDFEEDLGMNRLTEYPMAITQLKRRISEIASLRPQDFTDCLTVAELVELIDEERDL